LEDSGVVAVGVTLPGTPDTAPLGRSPVSIALTSEGALWHEVRVLLEVVLLCRLTPRFRVPDRSLPQPSARYPITSPRVLRGLTSRKGDCIGCGVILASGEVFFTVNGQYLGLAARVALLADPNTQLYDARTFVSTSPSVTRWPPRLTPVQLCSGWLRTLRSCACNVPAAVLLLWPGSQSRRAAPCTVAHCGDGA
jgi:hypothetical protein